MKLPQQCDVILYGSNMLHKLRAGAYAFAPTIRAGVAPGVVVASSNVAVCHIKLFTHVSLTIMACSAYNLITRCNVGHME